MRILEPKNVLPILHTKHVFLALEPPKIFFFQKKTLQASYTHLLRWFRTIFNMGYGGRPNRPPLAPQRSKNSLHPEGLNVIFIRQMVVATFCLGFTSSQSSLCHFEWNSRIFIDWKFSSPTSAPSLRVLRGWGVGLGGSYGEGHYRWYIHVLVVYSRNWEADYKALMPLRRNTIIM